MPDNRHRKIISIFGSALFDEKSAEYQEAFELGKELATHGFTVCNGGYGGAMEASSRGAKEGGGKTIGVVTSFFSRRPNQWIDEIIEKPSMIERLLTLITSSDGYIVLPGATGTLLELSAVWELCAKNVMPKKPIIVLGTFWNNVIDVVRNELLREGNSIASQLISQAASPKECVRHLNQYFEKQRVVS